MMATMAAIVHRPRASRALRAAGAPGGTYGKAAGVRERPRRAPGGGS